MECAFIYKRKIYRFRSTDANSPPLGIEMALEMIDAGLVLASDEPLPANYEDQIAAYQRNFRRETGRESRVSTLPAGQAGHESPVTTH